MKNWLVILLCCFPYVLWGQNNAAPALERNVTINVKNQPVSVILTSISMQADCVFSYNPDAINSSNVRSISLSQKPVRQALNLLFEGNVQYKERGKYVILKKAEDVNASKKEHLIEGYVYDAKSGQRLTETSIYDKQLLTSTITDKYGYFRMEVPSDQHKSRMHISKQGYSDTLISPLEGKTSFVNIELSSKATDINPESFGNSSNLPQHSRFQSWLISKNIRINTRNVTDTIFKNVQISLLPFVSTNKLLTGSTVNKFSLNLTVGFIQGVQVAEVGGVMNFVRNDAKYVQLAGVGNTVGGSNKGIQAGGVYNVTKNMKGVQLGGVVNVVRDSAGKYQAAGVANIVGKSFHGLQIAGVFNQTRNIKGFQIAGVLNNAKNVSGLQLSGLINNATYIKGVQLSVFNFADSCEGVPIGLFSFVKNGYHKIEISADELFVNLAIRTGVQRFHTMFMMGIQPGNFKIPLWYYGYGVGTTFGKQEKLLYDIDISEQQISKGSFSKTQHAIYRIYTGIDRKIAPKISIAVGIDYNAYISDTKLSTYQEDYVSIAPYYLSNTTFHNGLNMKTWVGAKIALRFL